MLCLVGSWGKITRWEPMNKFSSIVFGEIPQPQSMRELLSLVADFVPEERSRVRIWRGQGDVSWPVHSTAYRRIARERNSVNERSVQQYEQQLLSEATHRGYRFEPSTGRRLSDFELLALLRHYGAATRFVDGSQSALVALWFAAIDMPERVGALIGVHSSWVGGHEGGFWTLADPYDKQMKYFERQDHGYPQTVEPPNVTPRAAAQHSQFLFSPVSMNPRGSLALPDKDGATLVVAITPELKKAAIDDLEALYSIRSTTLFPDLPGFAMSHGPDKSRREFMRWA